MDPNTNVHGAGFRLHATDEPGCAAALGAEQGRSRKDAFVQALDRADPQPENGELVIDAAGLTFIDRNCLLQFAAHARSVRAQLVLRTDWPGAARLVQALHPAGRARRKGRQANRATSPRRRRHSADASTRAPLSRENLRRVGFAVA
ncbi:hypothetical protein [Lentzea sp. NBRC 102530]|uniref:hypothetical protein n=1 Tax=Lentzea sp. NBRC 102530 TaxID=3032201 RepID=UPI0024A5BE28|nr:hypothetical protein [Lentzea sp. NBRC 102530]GLY50352.1 hypothetical protein Lesp01_40080 [Lentzea sp. NBRC 102530]